jgi:hypothetical protein
MTVLSSESKWRPSAHIESQPRQNRLILKSDREFKLERIRFLAANGATLSEIRENQWAAVNSTGYGYTLPQEKITQFWNQSAGSRNNWATGTITAEVSSDGNKVSVSIPFVAKQEFHSEGGVVHGWIRLTG